MRGAHPRRTSPAGRIRPAREPFQRGGRQQEEEPITIDHDACTGTKGHPRRSRSRAQYRRQLVCLSTPNSRASSATRASGVPPADGIDPAVPPRIAGVASAASTHSAHNMPLEDEINARLRHLSREIRRFREEAAELRRGPSRGHSERARGADEPSADALGPSVGGPSQGTPQN